MLPMYRTHTYLTFHAFLSADPSEPGFKYFDLLKTWNLRPSAEYEFVEPQEKASAAQASKTREALRQNIKDRLEGSRNLVLIIGKSTHLDMEWIPFEVEQAVDHFKLPIIAAYLRYEWVLNPSKLSDLWPKALAQRIERRIARVVHIPFKQEPMRDAVNHFNPSMTPKDSLSHYTEEQYKKWGIYQR